MIGGLVEKLVGEKPIVMVENTKVVRKEKGILFRDTSYIKFFEGGEKWIKFGDDKTQVKFEGEIVDGVPNGEGTETYPDGQKYVGVFMDGKPHGQGIFTLPDGQKYFGEWKEGLQNGQGTYTSPDGKEYVGEFKDRKKHGQGTLTLPRGDKFIGEWKDGNPWTGKFYDKDGYIFGERLNGVKQ